MQRGIDGEERKAAAEERVSGISYFNFLALFMRWVLDGGIKLMDRSITFDMES